MMDLLASLNLVRRTRSVPNTITVIGVRKALLIGQPVYIFTHYLSRNSIGLDLIIIAIIIWGKRYGILREMNNVFVYRFVV